MPDQEIYQVTKEQLWEIYLKGGNSVIIAGGCYLTLFEENLDKMDIKPFANPNPVDGYEFKLTNGDKVDVTIKKFNEKSQKFSQETQLVAVSTYQGENNWACFYLDGGMTHLILNKQPNPNPVESDDVKPIVRRIAHDPAFPNSSTMFVVYDVNDNIVNSFSATTDLQPTTQGMYAAVQVFDPEKTTPTYSGMTKKDADEMIDITTKTVENGVYQWAEQPEPTKLDLKEIERLYALGGICDDFYTDGQRHAISIGKQAYTTPEQRYVIQTPEHVYEATLKYAPQKFK